MKEKLKLTTTISRMARVVCHVHNMTYKYVSCELDRLSGESTYLGCIHYTPQAAAASDFRGKRSRQRKLPLSKAAVANTE